MTLHILPCFLSIGLQAVLQDDNARSHCGNLVADFLRNEKGCMDEIYCANTFAIFWKNMSRCLIFMVTRGGFTRYLLLLVRDFAELQFSSP